MSRGVQSPVFVNLLGVCTMVMLFGVSSNASAQTIKLIPTTDHPTASDKVSGSGFGASEAVDIYFDTTDILLTVTTPAGKIGLHSFSVPADALPGQHWITAIGRESGDAAQRPFTVETDWVQRGFGARAKRINPYENVLNAGNVSSLDTVWTATTGGAIYSAPAVANGVVYVGSDDNKLYAYNATTGAPLWSAATGNQIVSSPAVANGVVYVGSNDDKLYAYNATTGALVWSATTGGIIFGSSPAVANGVVYVGSEDDKLYAYNATTGAPLWNAVTGNEIVWSSPAVANGVVYIGSNDDKLYAFNATTGAPLWSAITGGPITSSPGVGNGVVFVGSGDGKLYAYNAATGALLWSATTGEQKITPQNYTH